MTDTTQLAGPPRAHAEDHRIGIAIAAFNAAHVIEECLAALLPSRFVIVLYDDGSSDGTADLARSVAPDVHVIQGDGNAWWTGGTRRAVDKCFELGCAAAVMLNPDVVISAQQVRTLVEYADANDDTIVAPLVVSYDDHDTIAWAGSRFGPLGWGIPVRLSRYIAKRGNPASVVGTAPYASDEAHGRGVVVTKRVYDRIGGLDYEVFPHYGADVDYSHRARAAGIKIVIVPAVRARLHVDNSGMQFPKELPAKLANIRNYLFETRNGDAVRVLWHLNLRHLPVRHALPSYAFTLALNVYRRLTA